MPLFKKFLQFSRQKLSQNNLKSIKIETLKVHFVKIIQTPPMKILFSLCKITYCNIPKMAYNDSISNGTLNAANIRTVERSRATVIPCLMSSDEPFILWCENQWPVINRGTGKRWRHGQAQRGNIRRCKSTGNRGKEEALLLILTCILTIEYV